MLFEEREPSPHAGSHDEDERPKKATPNESTVSPTEGNGQAEEHALPANQGSLLLDATCAPMDIAYPTDFESVE